MMRNEIGEKKKQKSQEEAIILPLPSSPLTLHISAVWGGKGSAQQQSF